MTGAMKSEAERSRIMGHREVIVVSDNGGKADSGNQHSSQQRTWHRRTYLHRTYLQHSYLQHSSHHHDLPSQKPTYAATITTITTTTATTTATKPICNGRHCRDTNTILVTPQIPQAPFHNDPDVLPCTHLPTLHCLPSLTPPLCRPELPNIPTLPCALTAPAENDHSVSHHRHSVPGGIQAKRVCMLGRSAPRTNPSIHSSIYMN